MKVSKSPLPGNLESENASSEYPKTTDFIAQQNSPKI